jgi:hypothetical protein
MLMWPYINSPRSSKEAFAADCLERDDSFAFYDGIVWHNYLTLILIKINHCSIED